jgi:hypothetical protein
MKRMIKSNLLVKEGRKLRDEVGGHERFFSLFCRDPVSRQSVEENGRLERRNDVKALTEESTDHSSENIPCSSRCHPRVSSRVDEDVSLGSGN